MHPAIRFTATREETVPTVSINSLDHAKFQDLVKRKRFVSVVLSMLILGIYFGFILVLAFRKDLLATKIGEHLTIGVPIGLAVILSACVLTGIYVAWANNAYDECVKNIVGNMQEK
jgi:uncharacterized membrane protein (DUF485 family)